jgi:hypothetical protein
MVYSGVGLRGPALLSSGAGAGGIRQDAPGVGPSSFLPVKPLKKPSKAKTLSRGKSRLGPIFWPLQSST